MWLLDARGNWAYYETESSLPKKYLISQICSGSRALHYSDVIMGAMAYHQPPIKENIKVSRHWWEPVTGEFPAQRASNAENVSIWLRHHGHLNMYADDVIIYTSALNLDQFSINLDSNKIEFVNKAKYLGLLVKDDLSWDDHILQLCKTMNYCYVHVLHRLNKIFPKQ